MRGIRHIARDRRHGGRGQLARRSLQRIPVAGIDDEAPARRGEGAREGEAEPLGRSGDEGDRAGGCGGGGHDRIVELQVNLRSRGCEQRDEDHGPPHHRRTLPPFGGRAVGVALLRGPRAAHQHAHGVGTPPFRTPHAAPAGLRPGSPERRPHARRDRPGAAHAARGPDADQGGLGAALSRMAGPSRRADRGAAGPARRSRHVHRVRLSLACAAARCPTPRTTRGPRGPPARPTSRPRSGAPSVAGRRRAEAGVIAARGSASGCPPATRRSAGGRARRSA